MNRTVLLGFVAAGLVGGLCLVVAIGLISWHVRSDAAPAAGQAAPRVQAAAGGQETLPGAGDSAGPLLADDLIQQLCDNRIAFMAKYEGKSITVKGKVGQVGERTLKDRRVALVHVYAIGRIRWISDLECYFGNMEEAARLNPHDVIIFTGKVDRDYGSICLANCRLAP